MPRESTDAVVTIGEVSITDRDGLYLPDEGGQSSVYADYRIVNRYEEDTHTYMMGVTSPDGFRGDSCAFVKLAGPTILWIADWTASRVGSRPKIPHSDAYKGWVLLDRHVEPYMLTVTADGRTPLYRISGTYVYGRRKADTAVIKFPRPPWMQDGVHDRTVPHALLDANLIETSTSPTEEGLVRQVYEPTR